LSVSLAANTLAFGFDARTLGGGSQFSVDETRQLAPLAQRLLNLAIRSLKAPRCLHHDEFSFLLNGATS